MPRPCRVASRFGGQRLEVAEELAAPQYFYVHTCDGLTAGQLYHAPCNDVKRAARVAGGIDNPAAGQMLNVGEFTDRFELKRLKGCAISEEIAMSHDCLRAVFVQT